MTKKSIAVTKKNIYPRLLIVFLIILIEIYFVSPAIAANQEILHLNRRDKAFSLYFINDQKGWIVGDRGLALATTDGGNSWHKMNIPGEIFKDIFFVGDKGWIVGDGGLILHTDNGGKNWKEQPSNLDLSLMRVFFPNQYIGFAVGADGTILKTNNGGSSWKIITLDWMGFLPEDLTERGIMSINLYDAFFLNEDSGWIVGDFGTILHTSNGGKRWEVSHIGFFPSLFSICFKNNREGYAVGQNGFFLKTENSGKTWEKTSLDTDEGLYKIRISGHWGVIVGDHATILKSNDGGKIWVKVTPHLMPPFPWLSDTWILPSDKSAKVFSVGKGITLFTEIAPKRER